MSHDRDSCNVPEHGAACLCGGKTTTPARATKAQLRKEIAALRHVGQKLSNLAFNMGQEAGYKEVPGPEKAMMRKLQKEWDSIPRSERYESN